MVKHGAQGGFRMIQWYVGGVGLARRLLGGAVILIHPSYEQVISHGANAFYKLHPIQG